MKIGLGLLMGLVAIYLIGPVPQFQDEISPIIDPISISLDSLDQYVKVKDSGIPDLKPDNESKLIWADSIRRTNRALVYLHGFSASPMESGNAPIEFARRYGMNLYMPLLAGHGKADAYSFQDLDPNDLIASAKEAVAIGRLLGDTVVVMSCSTGSTLSVYLAASNPDMIDAMIMYSPNFKLANPVVKLATGHWGKQIVQLIAGDQWGYPDESEEIAQYWTCVYHSNGLIALQKLLDETMSEDVFQKITQPYFIAYYYENESEKDEAISVEQIKYFNSLTSTLTSQKKIQAFGKGGQHVLANPLKSDQAENVLNATFNYLNNLFK